MKTVDANALRDALYEADAITMQGVAIINNFPCVDAVEVVRCKYCRYRNELEVTGGVICDHEEGLIGTNIKDTDFCPYGERRTNG